MTGWIKLHRSIEDWKWVNDPNTLRLWLYILTHARHKDGCWNGVELKAGQMVIGRASFERETGVTPQSYRTSLRRLKDDGTITTKSTNKYTIITVENWGMYQNSTEESTSESTSELTSNQPATNQQLTTNKKEKKETPKRMAEGVEVVVSDGGDAWWDNDWKKTLEYYGFPTQKSDVDKAKNLAYVYSDEWLKEALKRTGNQGVEARNWRYVESILKEWQSLGYIDAEGKHAAMMEKIFHRRKT